MACHAEAPEHPHTCSCPATGGAEPARPERPTVIEALRRFLPAFLATKPPLTYAQYRAIEGILACRTPALGGKRYDCPDCGHTHYAFHSCNKKACPQCGRDTAAKWVERQLEKRVGAPHFMVTFTLPQELRHEFFSPQAKDFYNAFFRAVYIALATTLASRKSLGATITGFIAVLHTWNQLLLFHPHIHCIVPGVAMDNLGHIHLAKAEDFLVHIKPLRKAFKRAFREQLKLLNWSVDPAVWRMDWGVHIRAVGSGEAAIKYLGAYVAKTAIGDSRMVEVGENHVTFRWKDRTHGDIEKTTSLSGVEFVSRYLRHVLPSGMHSVRYYGFCHPAAKAKLERIRFFTGMVLLLTGAAEISKPPPSVWDCPKCRKPMRLMGTLPRMKTGANLGPRPPP